jgi:hypothetical protein
MAGVDGAAGAPVAEPGAAIVDAGGAVAGAGVDAPGATVVEGGAGPATVAHPAWRMAIAMRRRNAFR